MIALLLFALTSAHADPACSPTEGSPLPSGAVESLVAACDPRPPSPTNRWSVSEAQIQAAPCRRKGPFTAEEMEAQLAERTDTGEAPASLTVGGISFENESPEMLRIFERLAGSKVFTSSCKKVRCALDEAFGKDVGLRAAFILSKFGANVSPFTEPDAGAFSAAELDDVALGLADLPPGVLPRSRDIPLKRVPVGQAIDSDPDTLANAHIRVSDRWAAQSGPRRHATLVHELGHQLAAEIGFDDSPEWYDAGGWIEKKVPGWFGGTTHEYENSHPERAVSTYGLENPMEDFAESFEAYRYNGGELLKRSPEKYALLRELFFDRLEYRDTGSCDFQNGRFAVLERRARANLESPDFLTRNLDSAFRACGVTILASLNGGDPGSCIAEQLLVSASARALAETPWGDPTLKDYAVRSYAGRGLVLSPQERQAFSARARTPVRRKLREELKPALDAMIRGATDAEPCSERAMYLYQRLRSEAFDRSARSGNQRYEKRGSVTAFFQKVCDRAGGDSGQFRAAFDQLLPE